LRRGSSGRSEGEESEPHQGAVEEDLHWDSGSFDLVRPFGEGRTSATLLDFRAAGERWARTDFGKLVRSAGERF